MTTHNSHAKADGGQHAAAAAADPVSNSTRYLLIGVLVIAAFFGAYKFADASRPSTGAGGAQLASAGGGGGGCCGGGGGLGAPAGATAPAAPAASTGGGGGGCCGGGGGPATTGAAKLSGGVQKISIDLSQGGYNPNTIELKAGVPAEITFGQASGCTQIVYSSDLGFQEDLSAGPKTVKLPALKAGTYNFACGMDMVRGQIVVK